MKYFFVIMILIFFLSCQSQQKEKTKNICTRQHALDLLIQIPEVKKQERFIDSLTNHKHGLTMIDYDEGIDSSKPYYEINVGYSSDIRFENFFTFQVNKNDCSIWIYDNENGIIPFKEDKKRPNEREEKLKKIFLPISIHDIFILDYPTPDNFMGCTINGSSPTSMLLLDEDIAIIFFEGDKERWYLTILDDKKIKQYILIGKVESLEDAKGKSYDSYIDFNIDIDFNITVEYSSGRNYNERKIQKVVKYFINSNKVICKASVTELSLAGCSSAKLASVYPGNTNVNQF